MHVYQVRSSLEFVSTGELTLIRRLYPCNPRVFHSFVRLSIDTVEED